LSEDAAQNYLTGYMTKYQYMNVHFRALNGYKDSIRAHKHEDKGFIYLPMRCKANHQRQMMAHHALILQPRSPRSPMNRQQPLPGSVLLQQQKQY
jgi:hypothetical protein